MTDLALHPLLSATTLDASDCQSLYRALGEVPVHACSPSAGTPDRLAATEQALSLQADLREHMVGVRSAAFARMQHVLAEARVRWCSPELLARAPELLCAACDLDRAVLSQVDGSTCVPGRAHVVGGPSLEPPAELRLILRGGLLEAEAVRRRQALLVRDASTEGRVDEGFVAWLSPRSYIAAPLVLSDRVVGLFHADRAGGRVTTMDRDIVAAFASELARTYEHAVLTERFAEQRARVRAALAAVDDSPVVADDLPAGVVRLARRSPTVVVAREVPLPAARRLDGLTERETDVLRLMAQGATNLQVAVRLVVSESTVKSHVKQILRKLSAANRAEAVYLYLTQVSA